jgi:thioredoxin reductase (NADPH)
MQGCDVHIVGGGNSAGQAAVHLARYASRVTLVIRDASIAESMSQYLVDQLDNADNIHVRVNTAINDVGGRGRVEHVTLTTADGSTTTESTGGLFVLIGGEPRTAWLPADIELDPAGYVLTGRDLPGSDRLPLETSRPGVFAAGDVRHGSIKRVSSAVGEGALAVHACHQYLASTPTT